MRAGVGEVLALEEDARAAESRPTAGALRRAASAGRRSRAAAARASRVNAGVLRAPRSTRARAPRPARRASRARSVRRTRRSSRARPDPAGRTTGWISTAMSCVHRFSRCGDGVEQRAQASGSFMPGADSTPDERSTRVGMHARDRFADVRRVQPARQEDRTPRTPPPRRRPVDRPPVPPRLTGSWASSSTVISARESVHDDVER